MVSPWSFTLVLQSSGSSTATTGAGVDLTELGLLEPTSFKNPPGNVLKSQRLLRSRTMWIGIRVARCGVTSIIGVNFSSLNCLAASVLANITIIGTGSMSTRRPM